MDQFEPDRRMVWVATAGYGFGAGASTAGAGISKTWGGTCLAAVTALAMAAVCADISARIARNSSARRWGMESSFSFTRAALASILVFKLAEFAASLASKLARYLRAQRHELGSDKREPENHHRQHEADNGQRHRAHDFQRVVCPFELAKPAIQFSHIRRLVITPASTKIAASFVSSGRSKTLFEFVPNMNNIVIVGHLLRL